MNQDQGSVEIHLGCKELGELPCRVHAVVSAYRAAKVELNALDSVVAVEVSQTSCPRAYTCVTSCITAKVHLRVLHRRQDGFDGALSAAAKERVTCESHVGNHLWDEAHSV